MTGAGTYQPSPPDCFRCGQPAAEHLGGQCQAPTRPDCHRCGRPAVEHGDGQCPGSPLAELGKRLDAGNIGLMVVGVLVLVVGGLTWYVSSADAHECSSGLIYALAQSQCSEWTTAHELGGWFAVAGPVVAAIGAFRR